MESKKINQLATELAPELSDLTIIGDPTTGISKKITLSQMASLFTGTVEEYASLSAFPLVGAADTIYIALNTNIIYRWNTGTSAYVELSPNIVTSLVFNDANGFDGTISLVGSTATLTITTALTQGSVPFIGTSGALTQDNANLFFDDTNNRLGINTNSPTTALDVFGSGIIGRINGTSTNNAFLGFASAGTNRWSIGNVQSDHRFRIYNETTTSELVSVLQTGEFGIGIANPTTKLHIDGGASALIANLDANVSVAKSISFRSDNSARINLEVSGTESGSNAGANFFLRAYSDAGSLLNTPLTITRATGAATFIDSVTNKVTNISADGAGVVLQGYVDNNLRIAVRGSNYNDGARGGLLALTGDFSSTVTGTSFIPTGGTAPTNGMYLISTNTLGFSTNTTERLRITNGGFVGIATNNPATFLHVYGSNTTGRGQLSIQSNNASNAARASWYYDTTLQGNIGTTGGDFYVEAVNNLQILAGGSEKVRVTSGGITQIFGTNGGVRLTLQNTDNPGYLAFNEQDIRMWRPDGSGASLTIATQAISGTFGGNIIFSPLNTERMRITGLGYIGINEPSFSGSELVSIKAPSGQYGMRIYSPNSTNNCLGLWVDAGSSSADTAFLVRNQSGSTNYYQIRGDGNIRMNSIVYSNTTSGSTRTLYIGGSDYFIGGISSIRESKKNIKEFTSEWIYDLKPVQFNYRKKDEEGNYTEEIFEEINYGLIAEDTEPIADFLINYNDKEDGSKEMVGIEYSRLITPMLKEIQELKKEIELLKAK
jgi:hypothetical protein